jgi:hypothetical protein
MCIFLLYFLQILLRLYENTQNTRHCNVSQNVRKTNTRTFQLVSGYDYYLASLLGALELLTSIRDMFVLSLRQVFLGAPKICAGQDFRLSHYSSMYCLFQLKITISDVTSVVSQKFHFSDVLSTFTSELGLL